MTLVHIVQFQFKSSVSPEDVKKTVVSMIGLKDKCIHPTSKQPYILTSVGGANNSKEGLSKGLTHGFVVTFASEEDRDYYVSHDPAHLGFIESAKSLLENVCALDFVPDVY